MTNATAKAVAYYRVSTKRQGASGLGLEGQRTAVAEHIARSGLALAYEYTEIESGKNNDRTELAKAIAHAKRMGAVLVVAKLDRLARNVAFTSKLMEAGVEFVACDNPTANRLTIHILAAVAEDEARRISDRTKAALAAAKARGVKLGAAREGHFDGIDRGEWLGKAREKAAEAVKKSADEAYVDIIEEMRAMRDEGLSLRAIATKLTEKGYTTRRGKAWNSVQVMHVLNRFEAATAN